ncbi:twitching motility protein [Stutzerimonas xanthomarina]|uniref:Flp pilus assembly complex ATPase component TadA n=2 Tax=Stutzerimonas TaxID=2901164 RepID=A0AA40RVQ5_STUST|nr:MULTISPECIES: ATPase, T2SS/T4P/T4SS family [Stutzerimonas]KIL03061.1 twitching motility protein [Stutzerimonas stutzeri]MBA1306706.1 Flp pilus assembly complex ATPase component TadA [Stutzerimonas stutzeri]MBK3919823.1 twitching motility protein [Stutzerimonas frequens]RRV04690.1 twitching motility protein [Stutzerimonas xanthomarina]
MSQDFASRPPLATQDASKATNLMLSHNSLELENNFGVSSTIKPPAAWAEFYQRMIDERKGKPTQAVNFTEVFQGHRYRCILANSASGYGITMRKLLSSIPRLNEDLNLRWDVIEPLLAQVGLTLFCGEMGSGKSTTMISALEMLGAARRGPLGTAEDPIEVIYPGPGVIQREIGTHVNSFAEAIRDFMRQYRKTIMVGEIRDPETAMQAVIAASSGHRVVGTLHAESAPDAIVRMQTLLDDKFARILPGVLSGIWWQHIVRFGDDSRPPLPIYESIQVTPTVRGMIEDGKLQMVPAEMKRQGRENMTETATRHVTNRRAKPDELRRFLAVRNRVAGAV